jgi:hypothetical protein
VRREIITWSVVLAVMVAAFASTVLVLNASLYSASGFVRGYLDALVRHDADGALELAGTMVSGDASDELLIPAAMGELGDIELVSDTEGADGAHRVVFSYSAGGVTGETAFDVRRSGTLLGFFSTWRFDASPLGVMHLSVLHDEDFTANGVDLRAPQRDQPSPYLVFTPGSYEIEHDSKFLHAEPITVTATEPSAAIPAALDVQANSAFVKQVQKEVDAYLDDCATQEVLLPTGCPFGQSIGNRIVNTPAWSMSVYPQVTLEPGTEPGAWFMPPTDATAHLVVDVRSLFDGSVSTFDEDVPFRASYLVTFLDDDQLLITAQYD